MRWLLCAHLVLMVSLSLRRVLIFHFSITDLPSSVYMQQQLADEVAKLDANKRFNGDGNITITEVSRGSEEDCAEHTIITGSQSLKSMHLTTRHYTAVFTSPFW